MGSAVQPLEPAARSAPAAMHVHISPDMSRPVSVHSEGLLGLLARPHGGVGLRAPPLQELQARVCPWLAKPAAALRHAPHRQHRQSAVREASRRQRCSSSALALSISMHFNFESALGAGTHPDHLHRVGLLSKIPSVHVQLVQICIRAADWPMPVIRPCAQRPSRAYSPAASTCARFHPRPSAVEHGTRSIGHT